MALAMALLFFLVLASYYLLKPVRNSLFVDHVGADNLPFVYIGTAFVVGLLISAYSRHVVDRIAPRWLILGTYLFLASNLVLFWWALRYESIATSAAFYIWVKVYSVLVVSQFWLVFHAAFDPQQAKRIVGVVGSGGSLGAVAGAALAGAAVGIFGTANLLLASAVVLVFCAGLVLWVQGRTGATKPARPLRAVSPGAKPNPPSAFRLLRESAHLRSIAGILGLTIVVSTLLDWQMIKAVELFIPGVDAKTAFFGGFFSILNAACLVVQLLLTSFVLRRFGIGVALLLLPAALWTGSLGILLHPGLWSAVLAKGAEGTLRYSLDQSTREMLFLPLPHEMKVRAKPLVDVAVYRAGTGVGGLVILLYAKVWDLPFQYLSILSVAAVAVWVALTFGMRREYLSTLSRALHGRRARARDLAGAIGDAASFPLLRRALLDGDGRQTGFVLDVIEDADPGDVRPLVPALNELLTHTSSDVRERALRLLARYPDAVERARVHRCLRDEAESVRRAAVEALCASRRPGSEDLLRELLGSEDPVVRRAVLAGVAERGWNGAIARWIGESFLSSRLESAHQGDPDARVELALAAGALAQDARVPELLGPLLRDPEPAVVVAALRSAGHLGRREFFPRMIAGLAVPAQREAARDGLARQGERVLGTLSDYLLDAKIDLQVRRQIPGVLARIPAQASVDVLLHAIHPPPADGLLGYRVLKALNRLRARHTQLSFRPSRVLDALAAEAETCGRYAAARASLDPVPAPNRTWDLLSRALEEAQAAARERTFRCLALTHAPGEVHRCFLAIEYGTPRARATALEWLEHAVGRRLYRRLEPVVGKDPLAPPRRHVPDVLRELSRDRDPWVATCILAAAGSTAASEIDRRDSSMNLIEKVFLLRSVDLLEQARTQDVALLASITEEVEATAGATMLTEGEPPDAMYVVLEGAIELRRREESVATARDGTPFGTWALIDDAPSLVSATALETTRLLRIAREDFYDLLADHHELTRGLLQGLARRVRGLAA